MLTGQPQGLAIACQLVQHPTKLCQLPAPTAMFDQALAQRLTTSARNLPQLVLSDNDGFGR